MAQEQPQGDSTEVDPIERLTNFFESGEATVENEAVEPDEQEVEIEVADDEQPEVEEDAGLVELETDDGQTFKVPPQIKDGYLRHADYTRKTQELATLQRQTQAVMQQQTVLAQFHEQTKAEQQQLQQIDAEIARFKTLDWTGLDTDTILKTRIHLDQLKDQRQELEKGLSQKAQETQQKIGQARQQAAKNAYEYISKYVKDWTPDSQTEREVAAHASAFGIAPEALAEVSVMFPGFAVLAHKAAQYDKLQASKSKAVQQVQKAPPVVKPGAVTSTNSAAAQRDRDMRGRFKQSGSTDDFARLLLSRGLVK